ncbi:hypothetical protein EMCRGX_G032933 [Ephydatia muelleri]
MSSASSSTSGARPESSSSESSDSDARRKKRKSKSKRHKRHHHSKSRDRSSLNAPFTTMVPTPSRREVKRIKKGKYAHFDKLLSPIDDLFSLPVGKRKGKDRRQVCDLGSWFEAWNIFIAIRVQIAPNTALELAASPPSLRYDKLFRQAAARNDQQALRWDVLKEDLLVWCVTNPALRTRQQSSYPRIGASVIPAQHPAATTGSLHHGEHATHTASGGRPRAGPLAAVESTLPSPAPAPALQGLSELQRAYTPLRRSAFERELKGHPDKAWVSWLLNGIDNGVSTGCKGPHFPFTARNLTSALQHPEIVDAELQKEVELGRILGPFSQRPLEHLRTSGLGAVPKKNGKWRVILHLSAPEGRSINDFIAKEEFSIHYSTIDDAVALLSRFSKGARMAKVDLKSAFRMVPIQASEWELLDQPTCQESMSIMLQVCEVMGIPVTTEKCEGPATCITFLGIMLDSSLQQLRLPPEKLQDISSLIKSWLGKRRANKRELLSLIGKLSFAAKVVPAGRLFLRRLIQLSTTVRKLHHHIHLNPEARADLRWWNSFLPSWNGTSMFIAPEWGRMQIPSSCTLMPPAPSDLALTWTVPGQPASHSRTSGAGRALEGRLRHLLHRAVAPSTPTTYGAGIRKYYAFCTQFNLNPLPGSKHTINLFAAYLSQVLQANTTQVYLAAITHLHLTRGFSSPAHNNPTLNLAIRGMQRSQGPAHLRPKRLPLTIGMLEQLLRLLNSDPLSNHDKLMLKAALTIGFFGFLRVSEYTLTTRGRFDPRLHPTRRDVTWVKEGLHFLIKKSKTDQTGRGTIISMGYTHRASCPVMALRAYFQNCTAPPKAALFHFHTGRPLTSRAMRAILKDLLLRGGYNTSKYNTHSLRIGAATAAAQAGLPPSTIQRLGRWSSTAYTTYTQHPLTNPSDTATLASAP